MFFLLYDLSIIPLVKIQYAMIQFNPISYNKRYHMVVVEKVVPVIFRQINENFEKYFEDQKNNTKVSLNCEDINTLKNGQKHTRMI